MQFDAELELAGKTATGIAVPPEVVEALGAGKRVAVVVTIKGHSYRTTVAPYSGRYLIPVSAEHRQAAGINAGERVSVTIEVDSAPRQVEVPTDLARALQKSKAAKAFFESLSFSNQRGYTEWITSAKRDETRQARVLKAIASLEEGKRTH